MTVPVIHKGDIWHRSLDIKKFVFGRTVARTDDVIDDVKDVIFSRHGFSIWLSTSLNYPGINTESFLISLTFF